MTDGAVFHQARDWLVGTALPFWSTVGREAHGGFHERLNLEGVPDEAAPRRAMVQARQIAVFSLAHRRGWLDARDIVGPAVAHLIATYHGRDDRPGWLFSVDAAGAPLDSRRDAYSHAFMLFALGWAYGVLGEPRLAALAEETLAAMDAILALPAGGYRDDDAAGPDAPLRQNPHMHLFEALLVLAEAGAGGDVPARAEALRRLAGERFFQPEAGVLCEVFGAGWQAPPPGAMRWEPGHHFEWTWLLHRHAALSGHAADGLAMALYDRAQEQGLDGEGLVIDEVAGDGRVVTASRRLWPQCEAVRAHAAMHEAGRAGCGKRAAAHMQRLLDRYLGRPVPAGWIEHLDAPGRPLRDDMPASSLYHIAFAIAEADRVLGG